LFSTCSQRSLTSADIDPMVSRSPALSNFYLLKQYVPELIQDMSAGGPRRIELVS
jgi:hypothetical protein